MHSVAMSCTDEVKETLKREIAEVAKVVMEERRNVRCCLEEICCVLDRFVRGELNVNLVELLPYVEVNVNNIEVIFNGVKYECSTLIDIISESIRVVVHMGRENLCNVWVGTNGNVSYVCSYGVNACDCLSIAKLALTKLVDMFREVKQRVELLHRLITTVIS